MVRLAHHHRTTPAEIRTWPLPFLESALHALEVTADG